MTVFFKFIKLILFTLITLYLISVVLLYLLQDRLLYHTTPNMGAKYGGFYLHNNTFVHTVNKENRNAIIYFGGNAESIAKILDDYKKSFENYAIYLMDYRGYGKSSGKPNQKDIIQDATALYDIVKKEHKNITVIGRSLGSGVAQFLANKREVDSLVLVTPYSSIEDIAKREYPIFPVSLLLKDKYRVIDIANNLKTKRVLILLSQNDEIIPKDIAKKLISKIEVAKNIKTLPNTTHNTITESPLYFKLIKEFINLS